MPKTYSLIGLHLRYRLWIASLNHNIDVIRIMYDYMEDAGIKDLDSEIGEGISLFKKKLLVVRKEIDELRNSFHLLKMKVAAESKTVKEINTRIYQSENHADMKKIYFTFKKKFELLVRDFTRFEEQYFS